MTRIREATIDDAPAIAAIHVASWRTTYRGIMPDDFLAALSAERRERMWRDTLTNPHSPSVVYVAEDAEGRVAGFASGGPPSAGEPAGSSYAAYAGELYAIYLLSEKQGRGTGRALVRAVARRLADRGMRSMLVWVLADNPARRFYEALGGIPAGEQPIEIGGRQLVEIAYGWPDTSRLTEPG
jgi:GNAT superfamily N-acetyltransferase